MTEPMTDERLAEIRQTLDIVATAPISPSLLVLVTAGGQREIHCDDFRALDERLRRAESYIRGTMPDGYGGHDIAEIAASHAASKSSSLTGEPDDRDYVWAAQEAWRRAVAGETPDA